MSGARSCLERFPAQPMSHRCIAQGSCECRCLLQTKDVSGAAVGLRDSLGPRNDLAVKSVVAKAQELDPLVHAAVCRCCAVATPEPRG